MKITLTDAEAHEFDTLRREPGAAWAFWHAMAERRSGLDFSKILRIEKVGKVTFTVKEEQRKIPARTKNGW